MGKQAATLSCSLRPSQAKARAAESAEAAAAAEDAAERCGDLERQASQLEARLRQARPLSVPCERLQLVDRFIAR